MWLRHCHLTIHHPFTARESMIVGSRFTHRQAVDDSHPLIHFTATTSTSTTENSVYKLTKYSRCYLVTSTCSQQGEQWQHFSNPIVHLSLTTKKGPTGNSRISSLAYRLVSWHWLSCNKYRSKRNSIRQCTIIAFLQRYAFCNSYQSRIPRCCRWNPLPTPSLVIPQGLTPVRIPDSTSRIPKLIKAIVDLPSDINELWKPLPSCWFYWCYPSGLSV